jgi:hypothetical protein
MTPGEPFDNPPMPTDAQRVIILLTDGLNTENRWTTSQSAIDARTAKVCSNIKAAGITIYTVLVRVGSSSVLQQCASDANKYFVVNDAAGLNTAFTTIATNLSKLRLAR